MHAVSTATVGSMGPRPGRRRPSRGREQDAKMTSGSRRRGRSRGEACPEGGPGMVTKTQKVDLGPLLPERKKKKKKKKVVVAEVAEPETQYSVLNNNDYFVDVSSPRATSPSNNVDEGQVPEMSSSKRKKKKKSPSAHLKEHLQSETIRAGQKKSLSPRRQVLEQSAECLIGEKKKKRRKSLPQATSQGSCLKTSPDPRHAEEVSKAGKKSKKHRKEKKVLDMETFLPQDSWLYEAGDALHPCSWRMEAEEQSALGQKRKQGSPREHSMKKKKKKTHQEGDIPPVYSRFSMENSLKKRSKKSFKSEALEYIPIDSRKAPGKKKAKSKKKVEKLDGEGLAVKRKKKKRKENGVKEDPWREEEEQSDTDLEVVLEKKGNMDEACIDQVRRKALQEEIDRESGKTEASEHRKWKGTQFGQWDTAGFENEEQKLKFLKLMGGFKHLSPSFSRSPSMTNRSNMALDKKSSDMLRQNLQQDYDRAMSWKCNRGAGLGFSSEARKVFYIDRNASKSIKLQD
ncbi:lysine-rich nucleolar protein 1 isoform X1 [Cricetulus griseus]|uniref:Protein C16orf88-like n=1 Tax=Cricetulus griseus TaxID=10029 RepID=G3ICV6_CRIGR|nr:lysine-rich nucleolar protein 1 isoform X1 [Cricetulus griseus]EGW09414.1 Protein C16orf88-like [Cricetulus griseus]